ncbi:MAG: SPOR domain-containing protein [Treponema sp.]|nr:SPOR domain-containing protein [Treponema sp.]
MKKKILILTAAAVFIFAVSAFGWEGAASVSAGTDLPQSGNFVATNAYPVNTVVDVTNLDNNKTVRAIVAAGLDNQGLMVVVSQNAADAIGLSQRAVGRVSMVQPADPMASLQAGGSSGSGDPDHDPAALVASLGLNPDLFSSQTTANANSIQAAAAVAPDIQAAPETAITEPAAADDTGSAGAGIRSALRTIRADAIAANTPPSTAPEIRSALESLRGNSRSRAAVQPQDSGSAAIKDDTQTVAVLDETAAPAAAPEMASAVPNIPESQTALAAATGPAISAAQPQTPETASVNGAADTYDYALLPADNKLPAGSEPVIDPSNIVDTWMPLAAASTATAPTLPAAPTTAATPAAVIPAAVQTAAVPNNKLPADYMDPSLFVSPIQESPQTGNAVPAAVVIPEPAPVIAGPAFSAPVIGSLEKGRYYVQLGAYSKSEIAESELAKLGSGLPLAVQNGGTADKPLYRLLVGPLNLGESGALLQRFKGTYKDAFVRLGN